MFRSSILLCVNYTPNFVACYFTVVKNLCSYDLHAVSEMLRYWPPEVFIHSRYSVWPLVAFK